MGLCRRTRYSNSTLRMKASVGEDAEVVDGVKEEAAMEGAVVEEAAVRKSEEVALKRREEG